MALRSKEDANQPLFLFVLDAGEKFRAQPGDCLRLVEGHSVVHFTAGEMTRLTPCLKDWLNLGRKSGFLVGEMVAAAGNFCAKERGVPDLASWHASNPARNNARISKAARMMQCYTKGEPVATNSRLNSA